ncbi:hypothetical protein Y032_0087g2048 [Ancylostoma ceylanicum]|nr:hypothetical protein Y032_0087g2048 [Ancylostoma ceylanicum]
MFLQRKDMIRLVGKNSLDQLHSYPYLSRCRHNSPRVAAMTQPPEYAAAAAALRSTPAQMAAAITIDLVVASQREANFLRMIDRKAPLLYEADVVNQAIRRYETCWLPMQAAHPDMNVIPPLDVHWVWHTHMLSPLHYQEDCEKLCGKVIDHKLLSSDEIQKRYESSVRAWDTYCSPEPYDFLASPAASPSYKSICGYDIAAAVQRQRNFNYQLVDNLPSPCLADTLLVQKLVVNLILPFLSDTLLEEKLADNLFLDGMMTSNLSTVIR